MNSEREIIKRLFESEKLNVNEPNEPLEEKTYTVGDTQYWKRGGKCYKWTSSGGRQECSDDEYMKALSGGNDEPVKNTPPANDKARTSSATSTPKLGDEVSYHGEKYIIISNEDGEDLRLRPSSMASEDMFDNPDDGDAYDDIYISANQLDKSQKSKKVNFPNIVSDISKRYDIDPKDVEEVFVGDHGYEYYYKGDEAKSLGTYDDRTGKFRTPETPFTKPSTSTPPAKDDFYGATNSYKVGNTGDNEKDMRVLGGCDLGATVRLIYGDNSREYARKTDDNTWVTDSGKTLSDNDVATVAWEGGQVIINRKVKNKPPQKPIEMPKGMRAVQSPAGEMYRVDSETGSDWIQINPTGDGTYEFVAYDNNSITPTVKKQDLSKEGAFKVAKDHMYRHSELKKVGSMSTEDLRSERANILDKLNTAERYGRQSAIDRFSRDLEIYDEELKSRRYSEPPKVERDPTESDHIAYDGVKDFDHTTWMVGDYETTIQRNPSGRGYYLQNEDFDMDFDTKGDLVKYLRSEKAEFQGYDSENDY